MKVKERGFPFYKVIMDLDLKKNFWSDETFYCIVIGFFTGVFPKFIFIWSPQYKIVGFPVVDFMKIILCCLVTQCGWCGSILAHMKPDNLIVQLTEQTLQNGQNSYMIREENRKRNLKIENRKNIEIFYKTLSWVLLNKGTSMFTYFISDFCLSPV